MKTITFILSCVAVLATGTAPAIAQSADTITARTDPAPVELRPVWSLYGTHGSAFVGAGIGGIPDVNGDSIDEFAVDSYGDGIHIYYGSKEPLSKEPVVVLPIDAPNDGRIITGDFWGTGHTAIAGLRGTTEVIDGHPVYHVFLLVFRTDSGRIDTIAADTLNPLTWTPRTVISNPQSAIGADLDGDGADELIVACGSIRRGDSSSPLGEIWIFKGGPNFSLDTPTVILRDFEGAFTLFVGHWDHDPWMDLAASMGYHQLVDSNKLKIWFGGPGSPWNWTTPGKVVSTADIYGLIIVALDCDGDSVLDLVMPPGAVHPDRMRLYLSTSGKDMRTRSLDSADADRTFFRYVDNYSIPVRLGYLSDSLHRYEMLGIAGAEGTVPTTLLFDGGPHGPDHTFDAFIQGEQFGFFPLGDVTGDGWNDVVGGDPSYSELSRPNEGVAFVFAGGPYIPRDSLIMDVEDIAVAGVHNAVSVWPNPMRDELHIAWRGDLHRMPERFTVHDMLGREVARGVVESWRGEALWKCGDRPAGVYMVSIYDEHGALITTANVVKENA